MGNRQKAEMGSDSGPLHISHVHAHRFFPIINRFHAIIHFVALAFLVYYRASYFPYQDSSTRATPIIPWLLVFASELLLSFMWLLGQAYRWRPISRTVFPERLPENKKLPGIDVFICTADPNKEPTVAVMDTVLSAMAMDYPAEKLHVYLSDDGGAAITLLGLREAWRFARSWLPFCRRYGVKTRCPRAYFSGSQEELQDHQEWSTDFMAERKKIKETYEQFKKNIIRARENGWLEDRISGNSRDHPPVIEVMKENMNEEVLKGEEVQMPLLVYVSREKRPSHHHHFKAGALNVLLRVSSVMSNSPFILVMDCDMYSNDPSSARQAMCFHLDPKISPSLAFVQFPQKFHNLSKYDIYDSELRFVFKIQWQGCDGLKGPIVSGTNFYLKRVSLYGDSGQKDLKELKDTFGKSNYFIKTLHIDSKPSGKIVGGESSSTLLEEAKLLASSTYEDYTKWGTQVGFMYGSVLEDFLTSFLLHCKGWTSIYSNPSRPQFLGTSTTNLNDVLIQYTRWCSGLTQVCISKFCPLLYGPLKMSLLQSMCYAELAFMPLFNSIPLCCLATIPQLCLLNGIPLYPEVSNPFFFIFSFVFLSSLCKHLFEVLVTGGSIQVMVFQQRMWMIRSVTCYMWGSWDAILEKLGIREASFIPTNKVDDDNEQLKRYQSGVFDFQTSTMFLAPMVSTIVLNMASFFVGVSRIMFLGGEGCNEMFVQVFLSFWVLVVNYPVIDGMILRKDQGRIKPAVSFLSAALAMAFVSLGSLFFMS